MGEPADIPVWIAFATRQLQQSRHIVIPQLICEELYWNIGDSLLIEVSNSNDRSLIIRSERIISSH